MPTIIILSDTRIDEVYEQIKYNLDQRFHNYQPHFQEVHLSEKELGELETYSAYANHAHAHNFGRPV